MPGSGTCTSATPDRTSPSSDARNSTMPSFGATGARISTTRPVTVIFARPANIAGPRIRTLSMGRRTTALSPAPWIAPLLFNQSARDPVVFGAVTGALLVVAVLASMIPAVRGARVDLNAALTAE